MKVKGKIIIMMMAFCLVLLSVLGVSIFISESKSIDEMTESNIECAAGANGQDLSDQFSIYENIINVVGHDDNLYNPDLSNEVKAASIDTYAQAFGFVSGNILDSNGTSLSDGTDFSDRDYVQRALAGEVCVSSVSESKLTGAFGYSIAGPLYDANNQIIGVIYFRQEIDGILNILSNIKISDNSYAYILDAEGNVIVHEDKTLINNESCADDPSFSPMFTSLEGGNTLGVIEYSFGGKDMECGYCQISNTDGWILVVTAPSSDFESSTRNLTKILLIVEIAGLIAAVVVALLMGSSIAKPIIVVQKNLELLASGDFSTEIKSSGKTSRNELKQLTNSAASLQKSLKSLVTEANDVLGSMSNYDLTVADMSQYPGEFNSMSESINQIKRILNQMIRNIQEAVANVGTGAGEIADATNNLSEGTLAQASSIQQVVSDIESVAGQTVKNSENEVIVNQKLRHLDELIHTSDEQMTELRKAVLEIEEMSGDIQKIVSDIDSISFQTNILALNASVEAARAGESGKGFAVVADEVGNLANKSADSSKKTAELIEKCIASINRAKKCADETFESLHEIVDNSSEISTAFDEIASSTEQQASNAGSIKAEINKISDVVQTNTATAQQTAASTQVLSSEADNLNDLIRRFRV